MSNSISKKNLDAIEIVMPKAQKVADFPLGINTKSSTPPPVTTPLRHPKCNQNRSERYGLQGIARSIYAFEGYKQGLQYPFDYHRTAKCLMVRVGEPQILKPKDYNTNFYAGLSVCGSVWTCPVCSAKIQERRRVEIATAVDRAYLDNMKAVMVTLTFPHQLHQPLKELLDKQKDALTRLRAGNPWSKFKSRVGYHGMIRSLELTYGDNGWHPHTHELWFVDKKADVTMMRKTIIKRWIKMCQKAGLLGHTTKELKAFIKHSLDIKDNARCSDYLAKMDDSKNWGVDREMAKASTKNGKRSGRHPFGLLKDYSDGNIKARQLWLEYTACIHGKSQLFWSKNLKQWAGLLDLTDQEISERADTKSTLVDRLTSDEWSLVVKHEARAALLTISELEGKKGVRDWLEHYKLAEPVSKPLPES